MFAWASSKFNEQLSSLADTLAPPPDTPEHHFLIALKTGSELNYAIQALLDVHNVLNVPSNAQTGKRPIHYAAEYGNMEAVRTLLEQYQVQVNACFDYQGNTVLHYAAKSGNLALVQCLVQTFELHKLIGIKNAESQTPYECTEDLKVRQFLLPLQLQEETRQCIANGGAGLMPGIDMGGMQVNKAQIAPPPSAVAAPPTMINGASPQRASVSKSGIHSRYVAYDMMSDGVAAPTPIPPAVVAPSHTPSVAVMNPPMMVASVVPLVLAPTPAVMTSSESPAALLPVQQHSPTTSAPANANPFTAAPLPPPPFYAAPPVFVNRTSAAAPRSNPPRERLKPDGFHSSSSDKNLQEFYGHVKQAPSVDIPPPPVSNGSYTHGGNNPNTNQRYPVPPAPIQTVHIPPPAYAVFQQPASVVTSPASVPVVAPTSMLTLEQSNFVNNNASYGQSNDHISINSLPQQQFAPTYDPHKYEEDTTTDFTCTSSNVM